MLYLSDLSWAHIRVSPKSEFAEIQTEYSGKNKSFYVDTIRILIAVCKKFGGDE